MASESGCRLPIYAHARTRDPLQNHLDLELDALRRLAARTRSAASRLLWRQTAQRRANRVSRLVCLLPRIVFGRPVRRTRVQGGWLVSVDHAGVHTTIMTIVTGTSRRTLAGLAEPLVVYVPRPDLVARALLQELETQGEIKVIVEETL